VGSNPVTITGLGSNPDNGSGIKLKPLSIQWIRIIWTRFVAQPEEIL
jgi:hypothetical protein